MSSAPFPGGTQWYLPTVYDAPEGASCVGLSLDSNPLSPSPATQPTTTTTNATSSSPPSLHNLRKQLKITVLWRVISIDLLAVLCRLFFAGVFYLAVWSLFPRDLVEPGGHIFDILAALAVSAIIGGSICEVLRIPHLAGILWVGAIWANIPSYGELITGVTADMRKVFTTLGLTIILMRAGLSVSVWQLRGLVKNAILLSILPLVLEAVIHSLLAKALFSSLDYTWAFLVGFTATAVAPAVVVPGVLYLKEKGYDRERGPLSLLLSSVVFDAALSVWVITFIIGLAYNDVDNLGLAIAIGPIQLIAGALVGALFGFIQAKLAVMIYQSSSGIVDEEEAEEKLGYLVVESNDKQQRGGRLVVHRIRNFNATKTTVSFQLSALLFIFLCTVAIFLMSRYSLPGAGAMYVMGSCFSLASLAGVPEPATSIFPSIQEEDDGRGDSVVKESDASGGRNTAVSPEPVEPEEQEQNPRVSTPGGEAAAVIVAEAAPPQHPGEEEDRSVTHFHSVHPALVHFHKSLSALGADIWNVIVMPLLFLSVGLTVDFGELFSAEFFWRSLLCFGVGLLGRFVGACISCIGLGFEGKEVIGLALGWLGKASVQGAVGSLAFQRAEEAIKDSKGTPEERAFWLENATIAKNTAVLAILFFAPIGAVFLFVLGPKLIRKKDDCKKSD